MDDDPLHALARLNLHGTKRTEHKMLAIGSDVEIAARVKEDLHRAFGDVVHAEGQFWHYGEAHWLPMPEHQPRLIVHNFDGAMFRTRGGEPSRVRLGKTRVDSVLHELAAILAVPDFFNNGEVGINCASGFIYFGTDGAPDLWPHDPDHRCRHASPGRWSRGTDGTPPHGSLLARLLGGVFRGEEDAAGKVELLAEVIGGAALGYATRLRQPRAVILKGETAENGKSQILELARGLLPPSAVCSVTAGRIGDERHVIGLAGKLLNASDELSSAGAIAGDTFKAVITGEPVQGRDVYKSRVEFRPVAQHLFATNTLPKFADGMDRGIQRRLLVIPFNRVIPREERVEAIGRRIAEEEPDLLLAWAVAGAARLIKSRDFHIPASCKAALTDWLFSSDPVLAWLDDRVEARPIHGDEPKLRTKYVYEQFVTWAIAEGFTRDMLPAINGFVQQVKANAPGIEYRRTAAGRYFVGLVIRHFDRP